MTFPPVMVTFLEHILWSGIAALGFAILFNVPRRVLWLCPLIGATGYVTRSIGVVVLGIEIEVATLFAALLVGFLARMAAVRTRTPGLVFGVSSVIPMMPGIFAFRTMLGLLRLATQDVVTPDMLVDVATNATSTGLILVALAFGIIAPSLLVERRQPVV